MLSIASAAIFKKDKSFRLPSISFYFLWYNFKLNERSFNLRIWIMVDGRDLQAAEQREKAAETRLAAAQLIEATISDLKTRADSSRMVADSENDPQKALEKHLEYIGSQRDYLNTRKALRGDENGLTAFALSALDKSEAYYRSVMR